MCNHAPGSSVWHSAGSLCGDWMVPLTGPLLGRHCYPCVSVAVKSASSLLCCPTATVMLPRYSKCDVKSEVLTFVDIQSTCRICSTL